MVASRTNLGPGGKQPAIHPTVLPDGKVQSMVNQQRDRQWGSTALIGEPLVGKPRDMTRVLQERGLWKEDIRKQCGAVSKEDTETDAEFNAPKELDRCERGKNCCAMRILENQPDFLHEISQLEIEITKRGHECIFYPKFH